jgi:hypothetical protein
MKEPREPERIIQELHDLNKLIVDSKAISTKYPNDKLLALAIRQDEHRQRILLKELHLALSLYLYHAD